MRLLTVVAGVAVAVLVPAIGFLAWAHQPRIAATAPPPPASFDKDQIARGAKLAAIGNCQSCHTGEDGKVFAGGTPLPTPFGTIYGTNITPDPDTGIGSWSQAAFTRALRDGVDREGNHLYPAFPYDHFTRLDDDDVAALYAYLMTRTPVRSQTPDNRLVFPLGFRPLLAGWKLMFFSPGRLAADHGRHDIGPDRGAYLVDALAHCGACHTPRNRLGAEQKNEAFAGGTSAGWIAPALDAASPSPVAWTEDDLARYLRTGTAPHHGVAVGPMQEVAGNLAASDAADVQAMAGFIVARMGPPSQARRERSDYLIAKARQRMPVFTAAGPPATVGSAAAPAPAASTGAILYAGACAGCHDAGRTGYVAGIDLSLATEVRLQSPRNLLQVVLNGIHPAAGEAGAIMPGFADALTDAQVADLAAYVRARFSTEPPWTGLAVALDGVRQGRIATAQEAR